jgi:NAD(P)-dependent dehydrogenase (short-subunit alcohol dehydrogenase family)
VGLELTRVFLREGWQVYAAVRDPGSMPEDLVADASAIVVPLDVTSQESIQALASSLSGVGLDILINNAGLYDSTSVDDDDITSDFVTVDTIFKTNAIGPTFLANALLENLHAGNDKIVASITSIMGSVSALTVGEGNQYYADHWAYGASKAALNYAFASFGIRNKDITSVLIHPGWVATDMGGTSAPIAATDAARDIFALLTAKKDTLVSGAFVDHKGVVQPF